MHHFLHHPQIKDKRAQSLVSPVPRPENSKGEAWKKFVKDTYALPNT